MSFSALGWPRPVHIHPQLGFPVSRETPEGDAIGTHPTEAESLQAQDGVRDAAGVAAGHRDIDFDPDSDPDQASASSLELATERSTETASREADGETPPPEPSPVSRGTLPRPKEPRLLVVANQKGGVGKTTTAVNLAAALAQGGLRVLLIDLDPQGNASTALGVPHDQGTKGTYEVLIDGDAIADHVSPSTESSNLRVLPATIDLAGAEIALVSTVARENRLAKAIKRYLDGNEVDYVFFDCPPSLGLLTLNALVAAREILIPIQCEYYALEGVSQLMRTINLVKGELNDELELSTVVLTMFDARTKLASQVAEEVLRHFEKQTIQTMIPRSVRISEAPSYGQTVVSYDPEGMGARAYRKVAHEMARRGAEEEA